jgi:hypothetical protein
MLPSKYILLNCINWIPAEFQNLPLRHATEFTYFVLPVSSRGVLKGIDDGLEKSFVHTVHTAGKKATFSIAGGAQDLAAITSAVTRYSSAFIKNIVTHLKTYDFDGVTLDIENTNITPSAMMKFVHALRVQFKSIRPGLIIGCYIQPWQLNTVWTSLDQMINDFTWISPMCYDIGVYNRIQYTTWINDLVTKVGANKVLAGLAVNYPPADGGLNEIQYGEMIDDTVLNGWKGIGLWQNTLFTPSYRTMQDSKIFTI